MKVECRSDGNISDFGAEIFQEVAASVIMGLGAGGAVKIAADGVYRTIFGQIMIDSVKEQLIDLIIHTAAGCGA